LTAWPAGPALPLAATLGSPNGLLVANAALVPAGTDSAINLYPSNDTDVIIDVNGYYAPPNLPQALAFYPIAPCRVADTRQGSGFPGNFGEPFLSAGITRTLPMPTSACSLPDTAQAYSLNIGVLPHGPLGFLTAWPAGATLPTVATLGSANGLSVANAAIVPAGTAGAINLYASNDTDVIVDANGYFAPPGSAGALYYYPVTPCRIVDTRTVAEGGGGETGAFGPPSLNGTASRDFPIPSSSCGVPSTAQAYALNIAVIAPGPLGYLTTWPAGQSMPLVGTLAAPDGGIVGDAAIVPAGDDGAISVYVSDPTNLIIDIDGYFAP